MMSRIGLLLPCLTLVAASSAHADVTAKVVPFDAPLAATSVELKNDNYNPTGAQATLEEGFAVNEKAGVWVQVPSTIAQFKVDSFRVLMGDSSGTSDGTVQVFFQMTVASQPALGIANDIENAASINAGPYFNDIPAQGQTGVLKCATAGQYIGASLEFTQAGIPSVFRDQGPMTNPVLNQIFAVPGGWNYSSTLGLTGNWILRVVGHAAQAGEC